MEPNTCAEASECMTWEKRRKKCSAGAERSQEIHKCQSQIVDRCHMPSFTGHWRHPRVPHKYAPDESLPTRVCSGGGDNVGVTVMSTMDMAWLCKSQEQTTVRAENKGGKKTGTADAELCFFFFF
jgi:hypothetical protein